MVERARASLAALRAQDNPQGFDTNSDVWRTEIPNTLQALAVDLREIEDQLNTFRRSDKHDEGALLRAEQQVYGTRHKYADLLEVLWRQRERLSQE